MDTANVGEVIPFDTFALRAGAGLVLGVLVGLDREVKRKPLGARAYALIALGSACFMMVTLNFALGPTALERGIGIDPSRLIQGLVGVIGFLGAGAIIGGGSDGRLRGVGVVLRSGSSAALALLVALDIWQRRRLWPL
ncbi:MgtC/SapB family protein [Alphaproteobacteria bacterium]|nr:MgtC/SapB family protein [Alphaproteobacteria bacterium]